MSLPKHLKQKRGRLVKHFRKQRSSHSSNCAAGGDCALWQRLLWLSLATDPWPELALQTTLAPERPPGLCLPRELELEVLLQLLVALSLMLDLQDNKQVQDLTFMLFDAASPKGVCDKGELGGGGGNPATSHSVLRDLVAAGGCYLSQHSSTASIG